MLKKVVSGGQTGVDRAALDAAMSIGLECGGWCPSGRIAEDGRIATRYQLIETESEDYSVRTEWNVRDSGATLILNRGELEGGTAETVDYLIARGKPHLVVSLDHPIDFEAMIAWLHLNQVDVLNVAGPRESKWPGIQQEATVVLKRLFSRVTC